MQASLCMVDIDGGVVRCPEELPSLPDEGRLLIQLSEKIRAHGVNVRDIMELPHSPEPPSPPTKPSIIDALR